MRRRATSWIPPPTGHQLTSIALAHGRYRISTPPCYSPSSSLRHLRLIFSLHSYAQACSRPSRFISHVRQVAAPPPATSKKPPAPYLDLSGVRVQQARRLRTCAKAKKTYGGLDKESLAQSRVFSMETWSMLRKCVENKCPSCLECSKAEGSDHVMAAEGGAAPAPQSSSNPPSADPAWAHGTVVDMARRKVQCKYCNQNNFIGHRKQVEGLLRKRTISDVLVITLVKVVAMSHVSSGQGSSSAGMSTNIPEVPVDIPRDGDPRVGPLDPFLTRRREKQPSISAAFKNLKICKENIGRATSRWFFFNSIPANAAKGLYYESMIETISEVGKGVEGPTSYEIYNKCLDMEVEDMKTYVSTFERIWDEYGCTLMHYTKKYDKLLNLLQSRDCFLEVGRRVWQGEKCGLPISIDGQDGGGDRSMEGRIGIGIGIDQARSDPGSDRIARSHGSKGSLADPGSASL
ncbi:hypothetical protein Taro_034940 [Colocasia esculenta]|uniref:Uncharacterized protein n=1 Tax=Colocasia esculenta TaxID=4460 RepID=A0A843W925_COLES|nr:hypothetical protein [Colocasia esculenta]